MTTKAEERKALEQIKAIVDKLGENSYVAMAFDGAFEIAEDNIGNDFARSVKWYMEQLTEKETVIKDMKKMCESVLLPDELAEIRNELLLRKCDLRNVQTEASETIVRYAQSPECASFRGATDRYYKAKEHFEKCEALIQDIDKIRTANA